MTGLAILQAILEIIVGGLTTVGQAIGTALSTMASAIFIDATGTTPVISVFGTLICVFAGISLAFGLTRWVLNFITSFGNRNR